MPVANGENERWIKDRELIDRITQMLDLLYIGIILIFFIVAIAYTKGCDKLLGNTSDE